MGTGAWGYLFDYEWRQRADIDATRSALDEASDQLFSQGAQLASLRRRLDRQELVLEALLQILQVRFGLSRDELAVMVQRVDLADGVEDGAIGPDRAQDAPSCPGCGRPVNPARDRCLYCDAPVDAAAEEPLVRTTTCASCGAVVPEQDTYFSERGLVCMSCHLGG